jgi:8-amino-7-oxononanoate synthase
MSLQDRWQLELDRLKAEGRYRTLTPPVGVDFSSNDYLGYSKRTLPTPALSSSGTASRLLRGQHPIWDEVESELASWHRAEAALVMTSGYAANEGLLATVADSGDTFFSDQFNHASIIDGLRLSRAEKCIFAHNDLNDLEAKLRHRIAARAAKQSWFIVAESLYGMEGDRAPLHELADLADRFDSHLIVDEAHATGCFGATGGGLVDASGLRQRVFATVHTGSKALAVPGAYIIGSRLLKDWLVNRCRHFIFTTALPPAIGAWWLDALRQAQADRATRNRLQERTAFFRNLLFLRKISVGGSDHIATILLGSDAHAVESARQLQSQGFDIRAIRPPTVPINTARLRISIHADHEEAELRKLAEALTSLILPTL